MISGMFSTAAGWPSGADFALAAGSAAWPIAAQNTIPAVKPAATGGAPQK